MAQNDFLQFNVENNNTLTQEEYSTDVQRTSGVTSGIARSKLFNKIFKQTSVMSAAIGEVIKDRGGSATEDLAGLKSAVNTAFAIPPLPTDSYLAFCGNVNADMLDAAFGKNNEDSIIGLGRQLAMYAWYKGDSKVAYPFINLMASDTFQDACANVNAYGEMMNNPNIVALINSSPYAKAIYDAVVISDKDKICLYMGYNPYDYTNLAELFAESTRFSNIINNTNSMGVIADSSDCMKAIFANVNCMTQIEGSSVAKTRLASSTLIVQLEVTAPANQYPSLTTRKVYAVRVYSTIRPYSSQLRYLAIGGGNLTTAMYLDSDNKYIDKFFNGLEVYLDTAATSYPRYAKVIYCD